jgi:hypothetical protein
MSVEEGGECLEDLQQGLLLAEGAVGCVGVW